MDLIMGMNSGSSFDGIDVVLAETELDADGFQRLRNSCGAHPTTGRRQLRPLCATRLKTRLTWLA